MEMGQKDRINIIYRVFISCSFSSQNFVDAAFYIVVNGAIVLHRNALALWMATHKTTFPRH